MRTLKKLKCIDTLTTQITVLITESKTEREREKVCAVVLHIQCFFASFPSMPRITAKETNTVHKSHGWQLQELNPNRQREPSGGENLTLYSLVRPHSFSLYLAAVNLLKICGHKFNAMQVDGPTTNTHTRRIRVGGWAAEKHNRAIFQGNNEINRPGR